MSPPPPSCREGVGPDPLLPPSLPLHAMPKKQKSKETPPENYTLKDINETLIRDMDLIQILLKLKQFENLKTLILTQDQKTLLDFTAKPKFKEIYKNLTRREVVQSFKRV